jgi:predicted alpha/beta hydrolase
MKALVSDIRTKDGKHIPICTYYPEKGNNKVMVIAPTGGQLKEFYDPFARYCQDHGFAVISFDYRGMGESAGDNPKGYKASMHQWAVQDIDAVLLHAKKSFPLHEIIHVGHCIGGEIVGLAQASQYISRLVLINSALSCSRFWRWRDRFRVMGNRTIIRLINAWYGYFPLRRMGHMSNVPRGVIHEWANWCQHPNGLFDSYPDNNYRKLQIPILSFSFADDWHCPPAAVQELLHHFTSATVEWQHYQPKDLGLSAIGHMGFFIPDKMKDKLWERVVDWMEWDARNVRRES